MIVDAATFQNGRTVWRLEPERGDDPVPQDRLWIAGHLRIISPEIEASWLGIVLGPFIHTRLVLPTAVPKSSRERLEAVLGISILATEPSPADRSDGRDFSGTVIRDRLDNILSGLLRRPSQISLGVESDPSVPQFETTAPRITSNAGQLRRTLRKLDGLGELGTVSMVCPTLCVGRLVSFLCRDEMGGLRPEDVVQLAARFGIELHLPFAELGAAALGRIMTECGLPAILTFRCLWDRYRTDAPVMTQIYRDLQPRLATSISEPSIRICDAMANAVDAPPQSETISAEKTYAYFL